MLRPTVRKSLWDVGPTEPGGTHQSNTSNSLGNKELAEISRKRKAQAGLGETLASKRPADWASMASAAQRPATAQAVQQDSQVASQMREKVSSGSTAQAENPLLDWASQIGAALVAMAAQGYSAAEMSASVAAQTGAASNYQARSATEIGAAMAAQGYGANEIGASMAARMGAATQMVNGEAAMAAQMLTGEAASSRNPQMGNARATDLPKGPASMPGWAIKMAARTGTAKELLGVANKLGVAGSSGASGLAPGDSRGTTGETHNVAPSAPQNLLAPKLLRPKTSLASMPTWAVKMAARTGTAQQLLGVASKLGVASSSGVPQMGTASAQSSWASFPAPGGSRGILVSKWWEQGDQSWKQDESWTQNVAPSAPQKLLRPKLSKADVLATVATMGQPKATGIE